MAKTYLPTLIKLSKLLVKYGHRWYDQICPNCTANQKALLDAMLEAVQALVSAIEIAEGN